MSKPYANRPFPLALLEESSSKVRHVLAFWFLCNEFESDAQGWIVITRVAFRRMLNAALPIKIHNPTSVLEKLQQLKFIQFERKHEDSQRRNTTTSYSILILPNAWDAREVMYKSPTNKSPRSRVCRKEYKRKRYLERKKALLA